MASRASRNVRIVATLGETGLDERSWNALAACGTNTIFQTHQWTESWLSTYGDRFERLLVVATNGSSTTGVAPLVVEHTQQGRIARFIGDGRADYCDLLTGDNPATMAAMMAALRDSDRWDVLDLKNIPATSRTAAALSAVCNELGLPAIVREQYVCPTLLVRGHEQAALQVLNKSGLRRRLNRFERMGRLVSRDLTSAREVHPCLDGFFAQHIDRWRDTDTPSLFLDPANQLFYRQLTERLDGTGWLLFSLVELNDRPIALHYGFDYQDAEYWYKPSFDPEFASGSPGLMLVRHLVRRAVDEGRRELDFTVGDEPFKRRFTNHTRKTVHIQVFRDTARYAYERSRRGVINAVRKIAASLGVGS